MMIFAGYSSVKPCLIILVVFFSPPPQLEELFFLGIGFIWSNLSLFSSRQHNKTVSWLRKTEYISTEYNRFQTSNDQMETKYA